MKYPIRFSATLIALALALPQAAAFSDVPADAWYRWDVEWLEENGVIVSGERYRPADAVNRCEMAALIAKTSGAMLTYQEPPISTFSDVPKGHWCFDPVEAAAQKGIVKGYADPQGNPLGVYGAGEEMNRAEASRILVKAFGLEKLSEEDPGFPDVQKTDWFYGDVAIAAQYGLVKGYPDGLFRPGQSVNRAELAAMLVRALPLLSEKEIPESEEGLEEKPTEETPNQPSDEAMQEEPAKEGFVSNFEPLAAPVQPAGAAGIFVARYLLRSNLEDLRIETLTLANDTTGAFLGDEPEGTVAIQSLTLRFPDRNGLLQTTTGALDSEGKARFSNMSFFAPRSTPTPLEIYANLHSLSEAGENLSGEVFRIGLEDAGNDENSFRAVGDASGSLYSLTPLLAGGSAQAEAFTVRAAVPRFSRPNAPEFLANGENPLIGLKVEAQSGPIGLARLVFDVEVSDANGAGLSLSDFKWYRGTSLQDNVSIFDATALQDLSPEGGGSIGSGMRKIIVSFNQEETVGVWGPAYFVLKASAAGVEKDDRVVTRLASGDEETPLLDLTATGQSNTGQVYALGDASAGIFTALNEFAQAVGTARNIIWSDKWSSGHIYPDFAGNLPVSGTGSADWTNGYRLGLTELGDQTHSR